MLNWIRGNILKGQVGNECICKELEVAPILSKTRKSHFGWFECMPMSVKRSYRMLVDGAARTKFKLKFSWIDTIKTYYDGC